MKTYGTHEGYLYNLHTCSSSEAKRMWKESIKNDWNHECAYCGSTEDLTLDHIVPQCKGGSNHTTNILCSCKKCNQSKGHEDWIIWYIEQPFFSEERRERIDQWMFPSHFKDGESYLFEQRGLYQFTPRRNKAY